MKTLLAVLVMAFVSAQLSAEPIDVVVKGGVLVLDAPTGWKTHIAGPKDGPTIELVPANNSGDFKVLVTAIVSKKAAPDDGALKELVTAQGQAMLSTSMQRELELAAVNGSEASGYLYHLTDKNPEKGPGDFRELHQGAIAIGPLVLSVTVLTHTDDKGTVSAAMQMLSNARYRRGGKGAA